MCNKGICCRIIHRRHDTYYKIDLYKPSVNLFKTVFLKWLEVEPWDIILYYVVLSVQMISRFPNFFKKSLLLSLRITYFYILGFIINFSIWFLFNVFHAQHKAHVMLLNLSILCFNLPYFKREYIYKKQKNLSNNYFQWNLFTLPY